MILFTLACYHYYTAGFGIPRATTHRGIHMGASLLLIFLSFAALSSQRHKTTGFVLLGLPVMDWLLGFAALVSALSVPWIYDPVSYTHLDV